MHTQKALRDSEKILNKLIEKKTYLENALISAYDEEKKFILQSQIRDLKKEINSLKKEISSFRTEIDKKIKILISNTESIKDNEISNNPKKSRQALELLSEIKKRINKLKLSDNDEIPKVLNRELSIESKIKLIISIIPGIIYLETDLLTIFVKKHIMTWEDIWRHYHDETIKKRVIRIIAFIFILIILIIAIKFLLSYKCEYFGTNDEIVIKKIIEDEARSVESKNFDVLKDIFREDAIIKDSLFDKTWKTPMSRYETLLANCDFSDTKNLVVRISIKDKMAFCSSQSSGNWRERGNAFVHYDDRPEWILQKDWCGCWRIIRFTFHTCQ